MPTLIIDNQSVTVEAGTNVLQAAEQLGIVVPHFCYHEALGAVGACRLCAMLFLDGPVKGLQMSCMVEAQDGMVVSTDAAEAVDYRRQVIEWLMLNHPHDCPVCDEGGECQLQEMTVAGGHGVRRYTGKKRTYQNQDLGPFVSHEMNRCIQCYRCVRTYQEYCGGTDYGVLGANQRLYFGRFQSGPLQSPFAGNLIDVCPTGALTNKPFRFTSRFWDLQEAASICPHCSLGCAVIPGARFRELQRVRAGVNKAVNGHFICDRGRFGYDYLNHPNRPRSPRLYGEDLSWPQALATLRQRLTELIKRHGHQSVALLGSGRASLEANYLLRCLGEQLGCSAVVYNSHGRRDRTARIATCLREELRASLDNVRHSDLLLLMGVDPLAEGPMLALAIRQAVRKGARVLVCDPRPVDLPCTVEQLPCQPQELLDLLKNVATGVSLPNPWQPLTEALQQARHPIWIGGSDLLGDEGCSALLAAVEQLHSSERPCQAMVLLPAANSYGAALLAEGPDFEQLLPQMANGQIKALLCLEADPLSECPDRLQLLEGLEQLEFLAVLDYLPSLTAQKADLLLPTTATAEGAGTLINTEGRMQAFDQVFSPGEPLRHAPEGGHPPRSFSPITAGALPSQAWAILAELCGRPVQLAEIREQLVAREPRLQGLEGLSTETPGARVQSAGQQPLQAASPAPERDRTLSLLVCETAYGSEPLSALSKPLESVRPLPWLLLHELDAARFGIAGGDQVCLTADGRQLLVPVRLSNRMATGMAILPHLQNSELASFYPGQPLIPCTVEKVTAP